MDQVEKIKKLNTTIEEMQKIYEQRDVSDIVRQTAKSITKVLDATSGIVGILADEKVYYVVDINQRFSICMADNDFINIEINDNEMSIPVYNDSGDLQEFHAGANTFYMTVLDNDINIGFVCMFCNEIDKDIAHVIQRTVSTAFSNVKYVNDLIKSQEDIILTYANACEFKSFQPGNHVKRVSEYVRVMAETAGYSTQDSYDISLAAMMHDIGKVVVPDNIIDKPDSLTTEEFEIMKQHVTAAKDIIDENLDDNNSIMNMAKMIALKHHEHWDGSGYLGLKDEEIDAISGMVGIADVFDALVTKRVYKEKWTVERAYSEIIKQSGHQFSPKVVDIFKKSYTKLLEILKLYPDC